MACYYPRQAFRLASGGVTWAERQGNDVLGDIRLPCGQCIGCRIERSRYWATRVSHEAQMHAENCWVTLTYDDSHLPEGASLHYPDVQRFHKRLRKLHPRFRFFLCGEYGEQMGRPHYHACYFGFMPADLKPFKQTPYGWLYTSDTLTNTWGLGHVALSALTSYNAAYTARYSLKKITGKPAHDHYQTSTPDGVIVSRAPEFARMSNRPGIGATWFHRYGKTDLAHDYAVYNGNKSGVPDYYDKLLHRTDPDRLENLKYERTLKAQKFADNNTPERLAVRETVQAAKLKFHKRTL